MSGEATEADQMRWLLSPRLPAAAWLLCIVLGIGSAISTNGGNLIVDVDGGIILGAVLTFVIVLIQFLIRTIVAREK